MKTILITILLISSVITSFSQDFDAYLKNKNDNYSFPTIPNEMNFHEFYLLSQTFRMQDMIYSVFVPGYVHFKAQENKMAYSLVAVRSTALLTLSYEYLHFKNTVTDTSDFFNLFNNSSNLSSAQKTNSYIIGFSLLTIASTYLFDIIHGKYILEKKQEKIRFNYSPKISATSYNSKFGNKICMNFGISIYF